jgi:transcriptional regulator with XRE-family HTH domain
MEARGFTQAQIGERLGIHQVTVSKYLKKVRQYFIESATKIREEQVGRKLEEYRQLKTELMAAWERSKADGVRVQEKCWDTVDEDGEVVTRRETTTTTEGRCPEPRYIEQMLDILEAERRMLGLDLGKAGDTNVNVNLGGGAAPPGFWEAMLIPGPDPSLAVEAKIAAPPVDPKPLPNGLQEMSDGNGHP